MPRSSTTITHEPSARIVSLTRFVMLSGDVQADFASFADYLGPRVGKRPELASPIRPRT